MFSSVVFLFFTVLFSSKITFSVESDFFSVVTLNPLSVEWLNSELKFKSILRSSYLLSKTEKFIEDTASSGILNYCLFNYSKNIVSNNNVILIVVIKIADIIPLSYFRLDIEVLTKF